MTTTQILEGDCLQTLKTIPAGSVQTCVTSPPYYGLRDYGTAKWEGGDPDCDHVAPPAGGTGEKSELQMKQKRKALATGIYKDTCGKCGALRIDSQIGLEETPEQYVQKLVEVFREVRRTLSDDGTLWLNLGDSYWGGKGSNAANDTHIEDRIAEGRTLQRPETRIQGVKVLPTNGKHKIIKPKDLIGIPWMIAFALRADGWYLRSDIIWSKRNPMPESVGDRPTKAHEYIFLLSKNAKYYYDAEAILEPVSGNTHMRVSQDVANQIGSQRANGGGKINGPMKAVVRKHKNLEYDGQPPHSFHLNRVIQTPKQQAAGSGIKNNDSFNNAIALPVLERNKRSVWTVEDDALSRWLEWYSQQPEFDVLYERYAQEMRNKSDVWDVTTKPYKEAHFATFPPDLIEPCILAGSREGDTVLDPFNGSGTTGAVAIKHHRDYVGCELNPEYVRLTRKRFSQVQPVLFPNLP